MRTFSPVVALLVCAAFSGCLTQPKDAVAPSPGDEVPVRLAWGLSQCKAAVVAFSVPASAVAPHLPPGFKPMGIPQGAAGLPDAPGQASFGMEMMRCASGMGLNESIAGISYGSYFAFVQPPAQHSRSDVTFQFYKWDVLVPDEARRGFLAEQGFQVHNGTATFAQFDQVDSGVVFDGTLQMGNATHRFQGAAAAPFDPKGSFVEFTQVPRGLAVWSANYTWAKVAVGTAVVDAGTTGLAAEILGPGYHVGSTFGGVVTFEPGSSISLP